MVNVLQHVLAFLPNLFGFIMHLGGRDARVPVRAASRQIFTTRNQNIRIVGARLALVPNERESR
ncbi:MAG: hypothetical protein LBQ66_08420 [Planctomycetaceae bacterium]|nr:hypothetical protein [Planctomycetaceae bacterium]